MFCYFSSNLVFISLINNKIIHCVCLRPALTMPLAFYLAPTNRKNVARSLLNTRWSWIWTNSYSSSATARVLVLFYLVATEDTCSSSARTSAIHEEKFKVPAVTTLHNAKKGKSLRETAKVTIAMSCSFIILRYTKLILFCRNL